MISDELILTALVANPTIKAAAESIGVSEETVYSRLRDEAFNQRYSDCKLELLQECVDKLQKQIAVAVDTLVEVASDDTAKENCRVSAAEAIIRNFCRLDEHTNIIRRIAKLEEELMKGEL